MPFVLIFFIILVVVAVVVINQALTAKRRKELAEWAAARGLSFSPARDGGMDLRCPEFGCLRRGDNRYAYNVMVGQRSTRNLLAFDYHYETYSTDSKGHRQTNHHHFSALVLGSPVPLKPLFIRPEGLFDKVTEFFGFNDIDFEPAEFSRRFYVKAPEKRWAYDVLHPRTMEFMLAQPTFALEFAADKVIAYRQSTFKPGDFEAAAALIEGILDRLPDYVRAVQAAGG